MRLSTAFLLATVLLLGGCAKQVTTTPRSAPEMDDASERVIEHRIAAGESLALIADNYYGDPAAAGRIARDNEVADPALITPGSVLRLRFSDDEWESAQRRADALTAYNRGVDLLAEERLAEAEQQFRLAHETAPDLAGARYNLGLVLVRRGRHEEALPLLAGLATERPRDREFGFAYGHALFSAARFDAAADQFRRVLDVDPAHRRAAFGLARALEEGGQTTEAIAAWERYLDLDGTSSWADRARSRLQALRDDG